MIVTLTPRQIKVIRPVLGEDLICRMFGREQTVSRTGSSYTEVTLPYIGWQIIQDRMIDTYLTRHRGRRNDAPKPALAAMTRIARELNAVVRHPAMKRVAMLGVQGGWFPVWETAEGYSPMPGIGRFVVVGPRLMHALRGTAFTVWTPEGLYPATHWLADERSHTELLTKHG